MILGKDALLHAESNGWISIKDRMDFRAFSLDLRIGTLYRRNQAKAAACVNEQDLHQEEFLTQEEFINQVLDEINLDDEGLVVEPDKFYLWQPQEEIFLSKGFMGEITSRSGWARLGVAARDNSDDYLHNPERESSFKPLCILKTCGTRVPIKKGDALAQLFIMDGPDYVSRELTDKLIDDGEFTIKMRNRALRAGSIKWHGGIVLTMDHEIAVYSGGLLVPGHITDDDFRRVRLKAREETFMPKGTFFLSASKQYVQIPFGYVGYVTEGSTIETLRRFREKGEEKYAPLPFLSHSNAPYIGPRTIFSGKIIFENYMRMDGYIHPGMKQSELLLRRVRTRNESAEPSRYNNQGQVTLSRL